MYGLIQFYAFFATLGVMGALVAIVLRSAWHGVRWLGGTRERRRRKVRNARRRELVAWRDTDAGKVAYVSWRAHMAISEGDLARIEEMRQLGLIDEEGVYRIRYE